MVKHLISYGSENLNYNVCLHINDIRIADKKVMFITVTTVSNGMDYTVVFNGLPTKKSFKKVVGKDKEAALFIIKTLREDVLKYAIKYWNFDEDEWNDGLTNLSKLYE